MSVFCLNYGVIKSHFACLANIPISQTYRSSGDTRDEQTIADLTDEDELVIFSSRKALTFQRTGLRCKVSLLIQEPRAIQNSLYSVIGILSFRFHRILTHSDYVLERCKNAEKWIHGGSWVEPKCDSRCKKTARISIIASQKRRAEGHKLRHKIIDWAHSENIDIDVFGRDYQPLDNKVDGHAPYYFSVVIENSKSTGYFTEKIMDSILCKSVPIYWGDPDIGKYFDAKGMIICNNKEDLKRAISLANVEWYNMRRAHISKNRELALELLSSDRSMSYITGE